MFGVSFSADADSVGSGGDPVSELLRFRSSFSLAFPPSDLVAVEQPAGDRRTPTVTVAMLGLGGTRGPLPHTMTDWVLERNSARDFALECFLLIVRCRTTHKDLACSTFRSLTFY